MPHGIANLVVMRHGESVTNAANIFTGWSDPPLSPRGRAEATLVADRLRKVGLTPTRIFCSPLIRVTETVAILRDMLDAPDVPSMPLTALKERDYGALTGRNKDDAAAAFGAAQVQSWRRSWAD
ncbi:MAG: 2,3-bisphosphoglycerate-dependent phosphoglycerate mutase [Sphingomonas bacterium]